jgi:hypothetical protein
MYSRIITIGRSLAVEYFVMTLSDEEHHDSPF